MSITCMIVIVLQAQLGYKYFYLVAYHEESMQNPSTYIHIYTFLTI